MVISDLKFSIWRKSNGITYNEEFELIITLIESSHVILAMLLPKQSVTFCSLPVFVCM